MIFLFTLAASIESPTVSCKKLRTQAEWPGLSELRDCDELDFKNAQKSLNKQWVITLRKLKIADSERDSKDDKRISDYNSLLETQRAWLKYSSAQCRTESYHMRGGNTERGIEVNCLIKLTKDRTEQLRLLAEGF